MRIELVAEAFKVDQSILGRVGPVKRAIGGCGGDNRFGIVLALFEVILQAVGSLQRLKVCYWIGRPPLVPGGMMHFDKWLYIFNCLPEIPHPGLNVGFFE